MSKTFSVSTADELMTALATGGDTIELAGGDYGCSGIIVPNRGKCETGRLS